MATKDYASWSQREVERFLKLSTPDRNGKYEKTAEEVAKALGRSRYAIQSVRRKLVKATKLASGSRKQLIELLLVGEHRLAKLRTAKIPARGNGGGSKGKTAAAPKSKSKAAGSSSRKRPSTRTNRR